MIDLAVLKGSSFVVLGLARSGLATVRALRAAGIDCVAWDDNAASRDAAAQAGARVADPATIDWSGITALVISPGIPSTLPVPHPVAVAARAAGKPIICDVELLSRAQPEATFVAITGTNGKSTTTALIGHILQQAGLRCQVGGNIGRGALDLDPLGKGGLYVLELSSYQLELLQTFRADIAVWLNITPDHIDRHGDIPGYVAAKKNIFQRQRAGDCAVIGIEDEPSREIEREIAARPGIACIPVALDRPVANGISYRAGVLVDADGYTVDFADVLTLPGDHNGQNAACAWAVCRWLDLPREAIVAGMKTYAGLPHRQERVAAVGNIVYINDSKATNADATARALSSYDDIYWILGGQAKEGGRRAARFVLRPHPSCLPDRRGDGAVRRPARGQAALQPLRRPAVGARRRACAGAARGAGGGQRAGRRAALARLRVVGPVEKLRASGGCVPGHGAGAAGG